MPNRPHSATNVLEALRSRPEMMAELERFRRNMAVLFSDLQGSTAYFERHGDAAGVAMLHRCTELQREVIDRHQGRVIKKIGDAVLAVFDRVKDAVAAAVEMQRTMAAIKDPAEKLAIRIGLNYGSGIMKSDDVFGDVVNVASRIESVAQPEQIVISATVKNELGCTTPDVRPLGRFAFKGKQAQQELFEVAWNRNRVNTSMFVHAIVAMPPDAAMPPLVLEHVLAGGIAGARHVLRAGLVIGRNEGDLQFAHDQLLAGRHARFMTHGGQWVIEQLGAGCTMVKLIGTYTLQSGDTIRAGQKLFRFYDQPAKLAASSAMARTMAEFIKTMSSAAAELVIVGEAGKPLGLLPVLESEVTIGRQKATYRFEEDPFMSSRHCRIYRRGEDYFLEDLGSRNGTFVAVRDRAPLPVGCSVLVGSQLFAVKQA